jgi:hypothetical protein
MTALTKKYAIVFGCHNTSNHTHIKHVNSQGSQYVSLSYSTQGLSSVWRAFYTWTRPDTCSHWATDARRWALLAALLNYVTYINCQRMESSFDFA